MTTSVPEWDVRLPWLAAGTTWRGHDPLAMGWKSVVRSRQVHGAETRLHAALPAGEHVAGDGDGHVTRAAGLLLTVTLADCVPVFVADPVRRAVGLLHAGWRGTAASVLERGLAAMAEAFGSDAAELFVHLGPAICGECYEVGPEVFEALEQPVPAEAMPIDLRGVLRRRALGAGVAAGRLSVNDECTLCGDGRYYSHRRGDTGRHRGFIGILPKVGVRATDRAGPADEVRAADGLRAAVESRVPARPRRTRGVRPAAVRS